MPGLQIREVDKTYGETRALVGVSFEVEKQEIVSVLGPSGSGKSTLLSVVAGLEAPDRGEILWDGASLAGVPPFHRGFGLMFQDFALFPHRNVFQNVAFGLQMAGWPGERIRERVAEVLELVGLPAFGDRDVNTLSGGEQQRVALARSLAPKPALLMLDEPLGSLDRTLRERLETELREILLRTKQTALYVTHDQEEAFALADRVVVMNAGRVEQIGTSQGVYRQPASLFVARFLGLTNLFPGRAYQQDGRTMVETSLGRLPAPGVHTGPVTVLLRPDEVRLRGEGDCRLEGRLEKANFRGSVCRAVISVAENQLTFDFPSRVDLPSEGEPVELRFDPDRAIQVYEDDSEQT